MHIFLYTPAACWRENEKRACSWGDEFRKLRAINFPLADAYTYRGSNFAATSRVRHSFWLISVGPVEGRFTRSVNGGWSHYRTLFFSLARAHIARSFVVSHFFRTRDKWCTCRERERESRCPCGHTSAWSVYGGDLEEMKFLEKVREGADRLSEKLVRGV